MCSSGQALQVWDLKADKAIGNLRLSDPIHHLEFSPDGRTLVTGEQSRTRLWDVPSLVSVGELPRGGTRTGAGDAILAGWPFAGGLEPGGSILVWIRSETGGRADSRKRHSQMPPT